MKIALLIDSDNVSAKYISSILSLLSKYGKITIRRMYGDWSQDRLRPWLHCSAAYSLEPIMQMNNTPGKNASDIGLIIDAMDILYRNTVGGFCIASSDGDFNKLAKRLREAGKMVIGMGEKKTPEAFRASCERLRPRSPKRLPDQRKRPPAPPRRREALPRLRLQTRPAANQPGTPHPRLPRKSLTVTFHTMPRTRRSSPSLPERKSRRPSSTSSTTTTPTARTPLSVRSASASPSSTRILTYRTTATPN